jgi:type III restriction enzyme
VSESFEVPEPILNSPFGEPELHWFLKEGEEPKKLAGRRPALVYPPRDDRRQSVVEWSTRDGLLARSPTYTPAYELLLVNLIRERVAAWRREGYPGATRTTADLLNYWRREGRKHRLFFAQVEAAETVIFLTEGRADLRQGIAVPRDEPGEDAAEKGYTGFVRYACKMATGSGKSTVMAMIAAWSILNKVNDRSDARFSDAVLIVCPNVTIRNRLQELNPANGEASVYRTRDLVPDSSMPALAQGKVFITNWHAFDPQTPQAGGVSARVVRAGREERRPERIIIGAKTTTARGYRYMTRPAYDDQIARGAFTELKVEERDEDGEPRKVVVESVRYVESDTALVNRLLGSEFGGKSNILVMNDEAHHAYRIKRADEDEGEDLFGDDEEADLFFKEATVWVEGLDRVNKVRGINVCVDLSATPYYLGRVGQETNKPFPWVVSDFGLIDAIESGLVKIPQLAVRDTSGQNIPGYFNVWSWILPQLTTAERGPKKGSPKPEAILKYAHTPIAMLGGLWEEMRAEWEKIETDDPRPPVFILVCKNTAIAKVVYEWLADDKRPTNIPSAKLTGFRNKDGHIATIRVDSKVVHETDSGDAKSDAGKWLRLTLDTVGRQEWPKDRQGRPIYPDGFEELAKKLERPTHPPGRDVRCLVSVAMLTEGWDCNTVTHIVGLRPFQSQLLCEQVVGRGLRRKRYVEGENGRFTEEVAKVFGVPFEVIPCKANAQGPAPPREKRHHVHPLPGRARLEIRFPRVEGYTQAVRNRVTVDWASVPPLDLDPSRIPAEVEVKGLNVNTAGRLTLLGPGRADAVSLQAYRDKYRVQQVAFDLATGLTREYLSHHKCEIPAHVLLPQVVSIVIRYLETKLIVPPQSDKKDVGCAPYYGWVVERLRDAIRPDTSEGESPEVPRYETNRPPGTTADVDYWTGKEVREVTNCHLNYVVADTAVWEQSAAYRIDRHPAVEAFVKNAGLGFAVPYYHNGQDHDYYPDFIIRLKGDRPRHLILETKGYDPLTEMKRSAADRWVKAVNADGAFGQWSYAVAKKPDDVFGLIDTAAGN